MFKRRNIKRGQIEKIMMKQLNQKRNSLRQRREESYQNLIDDLKKKKSFDKSLINQKDKVSPTSRSTVRSFQSLNEKRNREFWNELDEIIESLDKD